MDINVNVVNQELKIAENLKCLAVGSKRFVRFVFDLGSDWDGLTIYAQFIQGGIGYNVNLDANNAAYLPQELGEGECYLVLHGTAENVIASTNYVTLKLHDNRFISQS